MTTIIELNPTTFLNIDKVVSIEIKGDSKTSAVVVYFYLDAEGDYYYKKDFSSLEDARDFLRKTFIAVFEDR